MRVRTAATRSNEPWVAAIAIPITTGTIVADEERQARRAQDERPERQPRLDWRTSLGGQRIEVAPRLADRALRVLEERDLGLVPAPRLLGSQLQAALGALSDPAPDGDVPALVVAVAGLGMDVGAVSETAPSVGTGSPAGGSNAATPVAASTRQRRRR